VAAPALSRRHFTTDLSYHIRYCGFLSRSFRTSPTDFS